jgi:hypothetical protein
MACSVTALLFFFFFTSNSGVTVLMAKYAEYGLGIIYSMFFFFQTELLSIYKPRNLFVNTSLIVSIIITYIKIDSCFTLAVGLSDLGGGGGNHFG